MLACPRLFHFSVRLKLMDTCSSLYLAAHLFAIMFMKRGRRDAKLHSGATIFLSSPTNFELIAKEQEISSLNKLVNNNDNNRKGNIGKRKLGVA